MSAPHAPISPNRLSPWSFVVRFGLVSMLADFVYEGARSITGPYLATFGASAALVGFLTGAGEAVALMFRMVTGPLSDRTGRHWALSIAGYAITIVSVPLLAVTTSLWPAAALVISERFGKAVRSPARDTMLAQASTATGRGKTFAVHEALDQSGALLGPLLVAATIAISGGYRLGFAVLAVPGIMALLTLIRLRRAAPTPAAYDPGHRALRETSTAPTRLPIRFWLYVAFTATSMTGFATFGVLAYHLQVRHVIAAELIPVTYAAAMGTAAVAALGSGWLYDRIGLRGLIIALPLSAVVPMLSFATAPILVWAGAVVWGGVLGIHESTLRAAVADIVPAHRRGTGYGIFTATYGLAWLAGSTVIGALYGHSLAAVTAFVIGTQVVALALFVPLAVARTAG
ncbi:MFS transporter [Nocardia stercoris]|uniref:MFS transporter n=1 Tax=Nocardia stercoris TaxID=2483361 RepID=A0A3M2KU63_9NOCA|nr:MFS transporter [Nocardia stercoris]